MKKHSLNHKSIEYQTIFVNQKFLFPELLWPYKMVSVSVSGNISWVCDPSYVSYALEQPEMLISHDYKHKCHAQFQSAHTVWEYAKCKKCKILRIIFLKINYQYHIWIWDTQKLQVVFR